MTARQVLPSSAVSGLPKLPSSSYPGGKTPFSFGGKGGGDDILLKPVPSSAVAGKRAVGVQEGGLKAGPNSHPAEAAALLFSFGGESAKVDSRRAVAAEVDSRRGVAEERRRRILSVLAHGGSSHGT